MARGQPKVSVVTGGSAGIGLGIAEHFTQEGGRVLITGCHQSELDKAVTAIGDNAAAIEGDTSNLDRIYATVSARAGHIDVLAANAEVYEFAALGEITEEHLDKKKPRSLLRPARPDWHPGRSRQSRGVPSFRRQRVRQRHRTLRRWRRGANLIKRVEASQFVRRP